MAEGPSAYKNPSNNLRFKNAHDLKTPESIIIYL